MAEKVKEVAAEEAERLKALTSEAVKSKAYLYPIKVGCFPGVTRGEADQMPGTLLFCRSQKPMASAYVQTRFHTNA